MPPFDDVIMNIYFLCLLALSTKVQAATATQNAANGAIGGADVYDTPRPTHPPEYQPRAGDNNTDDDTYEAMALPPKTKRYWDNPPSWWCHQMETFPRYWPFVRGIHRSPMDSPRKGQWRGAVMFSVICAWTNGWAKDRDAGGLRRHRVPYDVSVMLRWLISIVLKGLYKILVPENKVLLGQRYLNDFLIIYILYSKPCKQYFLNISLLTPLNTFLSQVLKMYQHLFAKCSKCAA